jgi:hypothetical protein
MTPPRLELMLQEDKEQRSRKFENLMLRRTSRPKREGVLDTCRHESCITRILQQVLLGWPNQGAYDDMKRCGT